MTIVGFLFCFRGLRFVNEDKSNELFFKYRHSIQTRVAVDLTKEVSKSTHALDNLT